MPVRGGGGAVIMRAYTSPTLVFLAFDWPDGDSHEDFLGFSILRDPGYTKSGVAQYLFNKIDFAPLPRGAAPPSSERAPIQKFNWWDGGIAPTDAGKTFTYTVTPMVGTGAGDVRAVTGAAGHVAVTLPPTEQGGIGTYFNRAVVSSQAYSRMKGKSPAARMAWLANGIEKAVPQFLDGAARFDCGIYHLTDRWKIVPAMRKFSGPEDIVYFFRKPSSKGDGGDDANLAAKELLESSRREFHERSHIRSLMHDKYIVAYKAGKPDAVLMGSMNFTPEAATVQANVVHTFASPELAQLYAERHQLLARDPTTAETAKEAEWLTVSDLPKTKLRVFFPPEPSKTRVSIDTVVHAVRRAKSSVMFCMFSPTDQALLKAILAAGDDGKIMYGLLNSIPDPTKAKKKKGAKQGKPPNQVLVEVFNRSRADHKTTSYSYFRSGTEPRGFLPELASIDTSSYSLHPPGKNIPAVHVHHKFLIIDADTDRPTVYTGSANMSLNSTNYNDENLLEISDNVALARTYLAEFMRLYNQYRARAVWEESHTTKGKHRAQPGSARDPLVLKTSRDEWVKGAYKPGTPDFAARTRLAGST
jgi:phosphatidylserine/phosphatidylglycerophosphate/cardiolipin synthase-like enzyme